MSELLLALGLGVLFGTITGIIPGVHVNTVLALLTGLSINADPLMLLVFAVSLSVTHSITDFIPSILLGAPSSDTVLSVLPGHRLLRKGKALEAIDLTIWGGVVAALASFVLLPISITVLSFVENTKIVIPLLLIVTTLVIVGSEKSFRKKLSALVVLFLAGTLGLVTWNAHYSFEPLFPALTGLFGVSTLLYSLKSHSKVGKQRPSNLKMNSQPLAISGFKAALGGAMVGFLPALGPSQAAFVLTELLGKVKERTYLLIVGGVNTSTAIFAFYYLNFFNIGRSGAAVFVKNLTNIGQNELLIVTLVIISSVAISGLTTRYLAKKTLKVVSKINYERTTLGTIALLLVLVLVLSGLDGLLIMITSTAIGLVAVLSGVKRVNAMAFLSVPTTLFYLGMI